MELNDIRARIDGIDADLTKLFVERMQTVADVAAAKQSTGKAVRDRARERSVINRVTAQAGDAYAPYVRDLYRLIFELSCNYQSALMGEKSALGAQIEAACVQYAGGKMPNRAGRLPGHRGRLCAAGVREAVRVSGHPLFQQLRWRVQRGGEGHVRIRHFAD